MSMANLKSLIIIPKKHAIVTGKKEAGQLKMQILSLLQLKIIKENPAIKFKEDLFNL